MKQTITDALVISEAAKLGIKLEVLSGACSEHTGCWLVRGTGTLALLHWFDLHGFKYSRLWRKRWRNEKRGKKLSTVLTCIEIDVRHERNARARQEAKLYGKAVEQ